MLREKCQKEAQKIIRMHFRENGYDFVRIASIPSVCETTGTAQAMQEGQDEDSSVHSSNEYTGNITSVNQTEDKIDPSSMKDITQDSTTTDRESCVCENVDTHPTNICGGQSGSSDHSAVRRSTTIAKYIFLTISNSSDHYGGSRNEWITVYRIPSSEVSLDSFEKAEFDIKPNSDTGGCVTGLNLSSDKRYK